MTILYKKSLLTALLSAVPVFCVADETVINGDGREIRLKDDGSWEYVSEKIYLDTNEGHRVVLTPDGRWQRVGLAPVIEDDTHRELLVEVGIKKVIISEIREKSGSKKNTRTRSTMIFDLLVTVADSAEKPLTLDKLKTDWFKVSDSRDKRYPVQSVEVAGEAIAPGEQGVVQLIAKGAPGGFARTRFVSVDIDEQAFTTDERIHLEYEYDLINRQRVNL